jgi:cysteinyl-tRNA synthetase
VRYFILASHYRSPLNYSQDNLEQARAALTRLYTSLRGLTPYAPPGPECEDYTADFHAAMDDDFNTPEAIAVLFELAREINKSRETEPALAARLAGCLHQLGGILGLLQVEPDNYLRETATVTDSAAAGISEAAVEELIARRISAREQKDWAEADRLRDELEGHGIVLEDGAGGTTWRRR